MDRHTSFAMTNRELFMESVARQTSTASHLPRIATACGLATTMPATEHGGDGKNIFEIEME